LKKENIIYIALGTLFILLSEFAFPMPVIVTIDDTLQGITEFTTYNKSAQGLHEITTSFENIGSVGCTTQVRVDFFKNNSLVYTSWSKSLALEPGDYYAFRNYWFSESEEGNITAKLRIYYCDEIEEQGNITFAVEPAGANKTANITIMNTKANQSAISITFIPGASSKKAWILPKKNPIGWKIEPVLIENLVAGEERTAVINYAPPIKGKITTVDYYLVTANNEQMVFRASNSIQEEEKVFVPPELRESLVGVLIFMLTFLIVREKKKVRRLKKELSKKKKDVKQKNRQ